MPAKKAQTHKQYHNGKTEFTPLLKIPKYARDPGMHEVSQPIGNKVPHFLADSFSKPGWNR